MSLTLLATLVVILGGAGPRSLEQRNSGPSQASPRVELPAALGQRAVAPNATPAIAPAPKKRSFASLFRPSEVPQAGTAGSAAGINEARNPRVICGLTVWQMTSEIDPHALVSLPARGVDFKIRRIVPPTCRE